MQKLNPSSWFQITFIQHLINSVSKRNRKFLLVISLVVCSQLFRYGIYFGSVSKPEAESQTKLML